MAQDWQNNYFLTLFAAAIIHSLYLVIILSLRSPKGSCQRWLTIMLLGVAALLVNYFIYISGAITRFPHLLQVFVPFIYLTGPAFYFFIRKSENERFSYRWIHLLHWLPVLFIMGESVQTLLMPVEKKLAVINTVFTSAPPSVVDIILGNRFNIITAGYTIWCFLFLSRRRNDYPAKQQGKLDWLRGFSLVFLFLLLAAMIIPAVFILLSADGAYMELTLTLMYAISIHILGYSILKHHKGTPWVSASGKYLTSPLGPHLLQSYKSRIIDHFEGSKPWLKPDFSIGDLSSQLAIPKHHLSQVLNEEINMSFLDLVNSYRIEAAKDKLAAGALKKYSVNGVAIDCGFTSKSTFNRTFKKFTGVTPSAYQPLSDSHNK